MFSPGEIFPLILSEFMDIPEVRDGLVKVAWKGCVGEKIRAVSAPVEFNKGILVVAVPDRQWQYTLETLSGEIVRKMNGYLRKPLILSLKIRVSSAPFAAKT